MADVGIGLDRARRQKAGSSAVAAAATAATMV